MPDALTRLTLHVSFPSMLAERAPLLAVPVALVLLHGSFSVVGLVVSILVGLAIAAPFVVSRVELDSEGLRIVHPFVPWRNRLVPWEQIASFSVSGFPLMKLLVCTLRSDRRRGGSRVFPRGFPPVISLEGNWKQGTVVGDDLVAFLGAQLDAARASSSAPGESAAT